MSPADSREVEQARVLGVISQQLSSVFEQLGDIKADLKPLVSERELQRERLLAIIREQENMQRTMKDTADELEKLRMSKASAAGFIAGITAVSSGIGAAVSRLFQ